MSHNMWCLVQEEEMQKENKELEIDNEVYWIREVGYFEIVANLDFFFLKVFSKYF